ncbi:MAG: DNA replication/repair protein RecF [Clostridiaceae bacterium]|jgi:DNA replication and repair protein RecF|nr:DNA replication/repair protein RecF [Clostridiaceae bacterium]
MEIKRLHLKNFRNYKEEDICFSRGISLIYGDNAQGKTNIIEALYLFATGKSHRTRNMNELIMHGEQFFYLLLEFEDKNYAQKIEIKFEKGKRKELFINEVKKDRLSDLLGIVPSVLFAPESLLTIKGSPGERRKLIDIVLCLVNKTYLYNLQKYNRILKNKNILLKQIQAGKQKPEMLNVWNESQAEAGALIIKERVALTESLETRMDRLLLGISDGGENIKIRYKTSIVNCDNVSDGILYTLNENMQKEIEQGICLYGPHRDDLEIDVNDKNSRIYCSQGQQRSVALALNIAILEEMELRIGKTPLLLLDDVMSELDEKRQKYLFDIINDKQTIITTTEKTKFMESGKEISYIHIKNGKIIDQKEYQGNIPDEIQKQRW